MWLSLCIGVGSGDGRGGLSEKLREREREIKVGDVVDSREERERVNFVCHDKK